MGKNYMRDACHPMQVNQQALDSPLVVILHMNERKKNKICAISY
jgi:hypothetical protein